MNEKESDPLLAINNIIFPDLEPGVINDAMITRLYVEQGPVGEAGRLAQLDSVDYQRITVLRIEFQRLMRIDHLWVLPNLQKLSLKFNRIDRIENLHMLTQLKELDLSYNKLERIENLEELRRLEVLTLMGNRLTKLENLDALAEMMVLSVGENQIDTYDGIDRLRFMNNLYSLTLEGNPIAVQPIKNATFRTYIAAFLPSLKYYNYKYIMEDEREAGQLLFRDELQRLQEQQQEEVDERERIARELADENRLSSSFVELLNGHQLFDSFFATDEDGKVMASLCEESREELKQYRIDIFALTQQIYKLGLEKHESRQNEINMFEECVNEAKEAAQKKGIELVEQFLVVQAKMIDHLKTLFQKLFDESKAAADLEAVESEIDRQRDEFLTLIENTWFTLMEAEAQTFESIEEANTQFGHAINAMLNSFIEAAQGAFVSMRDAVANFSDQMNTNTIAYLEEQSAAGNRDIPDALKECLEDKDALVNIVSGSRDIHLLMIDQREDRLVTRARAWAAELVSGLLSNEIRRNRNKVMEINYFLDQQRVRYDRTGDEVAGDMDV